MKLVILRNERRRFPISRVVYRGYNNANTNGGVSYANANNDASNSNSNVGSRLENKTKIGVRLKRTSPYSCAKGNKPRQKRIYVESRKNKGRAEFGRPATVRKSQTRQNEGTMRREGNIIEEITAYDNIAEAFDSVLHGTARKRSRVGRWLTAHRDETMAAISESIRRGWPEDIIYHEKEITECGKVRHIQIISMKDRIEANAVMNVVDRHLKPRYIRTTSASIKNRGTHDLMAYIRRDMEEDAEGTQYCYKFDISKFYESVRQDTVMRCVRRVFKDECLIAILQKLVGLMPHGLSIGLRSSQGLGNLLLSENLDHYLKDECGVSHFYRYCDDGVVLAGSKAELWSIRDAVHERMDAIGLTVKHDERVFPVTEGIDFLGYVIRPDYVRLRKRVKQNMAHKMHDVKSKRRRRELTASFYGMAKHADCIMLFNKLTGRDMKSFKDLNVSYKPADGKKRFGGAVVSIRELVNLPIIVKDYETGIKTEQGEDRCIVSIEQNGEMKKFFTNSEEMKNILAQISAQPGGFPFETTIRAEMFGKGRTKYVFS